MPFGDWPAPSCSSTRRGRLRRAGRRSTSAYRLRGSRTADGVRWTSAKYQGEPLAVTVNRKCPDPVDPNVKVNAAYTGISSDMEGARDPTYGGYTYYAPLIFARAAAA